MCEGISLWADVTAKVRGELRFRHGNVSEKELLQVQVCVPSSLQHTS